MAPPSSGTGRTRAERWQATRLSLVQKLGDWQDQRNWQEFFDTYWRLIYSVARKAGLREDEAQEVVQETVITIAKNIGKYDRKAGPFRSWLLHTTRWRIADQFRKRDRGAEPKGRAADASRRGTATIERVPAPEISESVWDAEWKRNLFDAALERVKRRVSARQIQIFDCCVIKRWGAAKVASELRVNIAQVYLAKHRVSALLKKEVAAMDKERA
ncbi:MAG TPA: sigma-70 family RNA polymerase sigma factor [Chthoniobacteraceae bacterium]|nr:polymerase, sigma-24 subunit, subfamily [Chthoniobacter sp.]HEV7868077.1 sigma-70 family RNA polymerase sigma factor [Chthoniobacteraceae bacterium]